MTVREEVARHGGVRTVETEPVVVGWRNVVVCHDGHRVPLSKHDEELIRLTGPLPLGYQA